MSSACTKFCSTYELDHPHDQTQLSTDVFYIQSDVLNEKSPLACVSGDYDNVFGISTKVKETACFYT